MRIILTALLAGVLSQPLWAQPEQPPAAPEPSPPPAAPAAGQVDFDSLTAIYGEPRVMINLGGPLMKLIAAAGSHDPEAAAVLQDLEGIDINVYDTHGNTAPALSQLHKASSALAAQSWQPIMQVREDGENVQMFTRMADDRMQGMAIMVVNREEAVFINIRGQIDPAAVGKVMEHLDVQVNTP